MIPPLSPRSANFVNIVSNLKRSIEEAFSSASLIQNDVYRNIFSKALRSFLSRCERMVEALEKRGEYAFPLFGIEAQAAEGKIQRKIQKMKNRHLSQEDEQRVQLIFTVFQQKITLLTEPFRLAPISTPSVSQENPQITESKQAILKVLFNQTLESICSKLDIHLECFISYSWGNLKDARLTHRIAEDLKKAGIRVFFDMLEIKPGDDIIQYIGKIRSCSYVLYIGTPELIHKFEKRTDEKIALELDSISVKYREDPRSVVPCLVSGEPVFPHFLGGGKNLAYVDFRKDKDYEDRLFDVILKLLEHSYHLKEIEAICFEFHQQKAFIISDKYPREELEKRLSEIQQRKMQENAKYERSIDVMLEAAHSRLLLRSRSAISRINLRPPLDNFIGRNNELLALEKALLPSKTWNVNLPTCMIILTGSGGVGKSELACCFANRYLQNYSFVCCINCETQEMQLQAYNELAKLLNIYLDPETTSEEVLRTVNGHLENHAFNKPWLLIFDNVQERLCFPERGGCILGTSIRRDLWPYPERCLEVPVFSEQEAVQYVRERIKQKDEVNIRQLVHQLGCFPLAIAQTAAFIAQAGISVSSYLQDFKTHQLEYLEGEGTPRHQFSLITTWSITLKHLKQQHPQAFTWLNICAHLRSEKIPQKWIGDWLEIHGSELRELAVFQVLKVLQNYSLIRSDPSSESFSFHHLMSSVVCQLQRQEAVIFYQKALFMLREQGTKFNEDHVETMEGAEIWLSHAEILIRNKLFDQQIFEVQEEIWYRLGLISKWLGDYRKALHATEKAYEIICKSPTPSDCSKVAACLNNTGLLLLYLGRNDEALTFLTKALKTEKISDSSADRLNAAIRLNNIASAFSALGRLDEALSYLKDALKIVEEMGDQYYQPPTVSILCNRGNILLALDQKREALSSFQEALLIARRIFGPEGHPTLAIVLNNMGGILSSLNRHEEAVEAHREALDMLRRTYGNEDHPNIIRYLNNLGRTLVDQDQKEAALEAFDEAIKISEKIYGSAGHLILVTCLRNRADILSHLKRYQEALNSYHEARRILQKIKGTSDNVSLVFCLYEIGRCLIKIDRKKDALQAFQEAFHLSRKSYRPEEQNKFILFFHNIGMQLLTFECNQEALHVFSEILKLLRELYPSKNHPDIAKYLNYQGMALFALGRDKKALESHQKALEILRRLYLFADHPTIAVYLNNIGFIWLNRGKNGKALKVLQEALVMQRSLYGQEDHPEIETTLSRLGSVFYAQGNFKAAYTHHKQALEMLLRISEGIIHSDIAISYNNLGTDLSALGRKDEALKCHLQALKIHKKKYGDKDNSRLILSFRNIGRVLVDLGRNAEAEKYFQDADNMQKRLDRASPFDPTQSSEELGHTLLRHGYIEDALDHFQRLDQLKLKLNFLNIDYNPRFSFGVYRGSARSSTMTISDCLSQDMRRSLVISENSNVQMGERQQRGSLNIGQKSSNKSLPDYESKSLEVNSSNYRFFEQDLEICHDKALPSSDNVTRVYHHPDSSFKWSKAMIATKLWLNPKTIISEEMVLKINFVHTYLSSKGFELKGVKADGNCFCSAFWGSYKTLSRKIPLLDSSQDKIIFLRGQIAAQYEHSPQGSKNGTRVEQIKKNTEWLAAFDEGDLLAVALKIPIRLITVNIDGSNCGVSDLLTFADGKRSRQEWDTIPENERPLEFIMIVDVGGHFLYAQKSNKPVTQ